MRGSLPQTTQSIHCYSVTSFVLILLLLLTPTTTNVYAFSSIAKPHFRPIHHAARLNHHHPNIINSRPLPQQQYYHHELNLFGSSIGKGRHSYQSFHSPTSTTKHHQRHSTTSTSIHMALPNTSMILVQSLYLRCLGFVAMMTFLVAWRQNKALIGDDGITPAKYVLEQAEHYGTIKQQQRQLLQQVSNHPTSANATTSSATIHRNNFRFRNPFTWYVRQIGRTVRTYLDQYPSWRKFRFIWWDCSDANDRPLTTLLWLAQNRTQLDPVLDSIAQTGLAISFFLFAKGTANVPLLAGLWLCHRSLWMVGGPWYHYGWEAQLSELFFHTMFLVPLWKMDPWHCNSSNVVVGTSANIIRWCIRWHLFRVMMGAGLIKLRSPDRKWNNGSAMRYFYETQPIPNPLSRYFHWMPIWWHQFEVIINFIVELIAPWLLIVPGLPVNWRRAGGIIQIVFQMILMLSGNFSFLNCLTTVPAILCLDDALVGRFFPPLQQSAALSISNTAMWQQYPSMNARRYISYAFLLCILRLSIPVIRNMFSQHQVMNRSYDPMRLVSTYGAFGSVREVREEWIISSAVHWDGPWREYEFKAKPGNIDQHPHLVAPYHYRLDWQMWIIATTGTIHSGNSHPHTTWMYTFLLKLLQQNTLILNELMIGDPWKKEDNGTEDVSSKIVLEEEDLHPKYIRIQRYRYHFHRSNKEDNVKSNDHSAPPYWDRELLDQVYPRHGLATIESLQQEIDSCINIATQR